MEKRLLLVMLDLECEGAIKNRICFASIFFIDIYLFIFRLLNIIKLTRESHELLREMPQDYQVPSDVREQREYHQG